MIKLTVEIVYQEVIFEGLESALVRGVSINIEGGTIILGNVRQLLELAARNMDNQPVEHLDSILTSQGLRENKGLPSAVLEALRDINAKSDVKIELNNQKDEEDIS